MLLLVPVVMLEKLSAESPLPGQSDHWRGGLTGPPADRLGLQSQPNDTRPMLNFSNLTRIAVRSILIQQGPQTCSDLVRLMGMDPQRHKGTIHAIMVDMEDDGILTASRSNNGKRNQWSIINIRKRDRLAAALIG